MHSKVKYLDFKGIDKKEQILFKSYLNLAKNELEYQVVILTGEARQDGEQSTEPDLLIVDANFEFDDQEQSYEQLPSIIVGSDFAEERPGYISRPVQWSDFKDELSKLTFTPDSEPEESEQDRLLPDKMKFVIADMDEKTTVIETQSDQSTDQLDEYDYELGSMSVDYHSITNSDYVKVVDDVKGFKEDKDEDYDTGVSQAIILVTDDESTSSNSVLVIETDSMEAWDFDEMAEEEAALVEEQEVDAEVDEVDKRKEAQVLQKLKAGTIINSGDVFWESDGEIYSETEELLFIQANKDSVLSAKEPAKWSAALRSKQITKLPLQSGWVPSEGLNAYPISRLVWANTIANGYKALMDDIDVNGMYMLERWPHFDLLELDNMLLKLCTMLFIGPESPHSLMQKTGYSRSVVYGLINACHEAGLLVSEEELIAKGLTKKEAVEEGMLGKIKEVFR